jgi:GT2 family glycosyltransferase
MHKISIIIPVWNGRELLDKNLPAVLAAANDEKNQIQEVILVDDKSTDSSVAYLEELASKIRLIRHKENRGFSAAVNTGVRAAKGQLVCLLNQDVSPSADFLAGVLPHFQSEQVFGVSLHEEGYGYAIGKFNNGFIVHEPRQAEKTMETFWANGGSSVFRRSVWVELRGLDEELFSPFYWEDIDLCYRALKRGYKLLWEPKARVIHEHGSAIKKLNKKRVKRIQERNQLLFIWKNLTSPTLFRKHLRGLVSRLLSHPGYLVIFLMALRKIRVVWKLRKKEKRETKVSDEAVFARFK